MAAYYNEIEPYAAQWLRNLIAAGHIAPGDVDERSIEDVCPDDLKPYTQCHFFAGIGVWSHALRLAGWPDDRPVWTGSCPCQPFSAAGKGGGFADERHLWPAFHHLISQRRPPTVFGEQVASKDGLAWLDLVQADLEGSDYATTSVDLCAAGIGAPHIRQRLYWVANASMRRQSRGIWECGQAEWSAEPFGGHGSSDALADAKSGGRSIRRNAVVPWQGGYPDGTSDTSGSMADADNSGLERWRFGERKRTYKRATGPHGMACHKSATGPTNGIWRDADWLYCRDGKWRPVEPGTFPLVNGTPSRVGRLRAYGNAIIPQVASEVISAYMAID